MADLKLSEVDNFNVTPVALEIFCYQASVTMMRLVLATKQASTFKHTSVHIFNLTYLHQIDKCQLIFGPIAPSLFVLVKEILGRCQFGNMTISDSANCFYKVF